MTDVSRPFFLLESRLSGEPARLYESPIESVSARTADDVFACLKAVESWQERGDHAIVILHYEAALAFNELPVIETSGDSVLARCYRFSSYTALDSDQVELWLESQVKEGSCSINECHLRCTQKEYAEAFRKVQAAIRRGDTYQVNLTSAYNWRYQGDEVAWYRLLRKQQPVDFSALLAFPDETILSLSPELFYRKEGTQISTRPMKGTSKRFLDDPVRDQAAATHLQEHSKTRAENVMIVDLMRNDLNRIAKTGSVSVDDLCAIESYPSVHQMVTTVQAEVDSSLSLTRIMQALFPSGSITGAPKRRTMQCIKELEQTPRGVYTGAIGYVTPDNDQCFNIPIRTLCLRDGKGHLGVGGGLVHQSECDSEFDEMMLKADFFMKAIP